MTKNELNNCPGCGAKPGHFHVDGCDVERCHHCGLQALSCNTKPSKRMRWTGQWPGTAECQRYGFFAKMIPGLGWVPVDPSIYGAIPDLNRLYATCKWNTKTQTWDHITQAT